MPWSPAIRIEGIREAVMAAANEQLRALKASPAVSIVAGGKRGADTNAMIAAVQGDRGRDPFYMPGDSINAVKFAVSRGAGADGYPDALLKQIGNLMLEAIGENLKAQKTRGGGPFTPLSPGYAAWKQKHFGTKPILMATGDLMNGLTVRIDRSMSDGVQRAA